MTAPFTEGQWVARKVDRYDGGWAIDCAGYRIAMVPNGSQEPANAANALLIAAAPALLAKLRDVAAGCGECAGSGRRSYFSGQASPDEHCPDCQDLRDLIALATVPAEVAA